MEGLSLRPKGAAALPAPEGRSPPLRLNARRGLTRRKKGSHYKPKGASGSAAPGVGAPSATEPRSATRNDRRRHHTATEGSRGSACTGRGAPSDAE